MAEELTIAAMLAAKRELGTVVRCVVLVPPGVELGPEELLRYVQGWEEKHPPQPGERYEYRVLPHAHMPVGQLCIMRADLFDTPPLPTFDWERR